MSSLSHETLDLLRRVSTATLTTQLFKRGLRNAFMQGVRPLGQYGGNLVGDRLPASKWYVSPPMGDSLPHPNSGMLQLS